MTIHPTYEQLNDWLDGELAEVDAQRIAAHCAACAECATEVTRLRELLRMSSALPRSMDPPADVWESIAEVTIGRRPSRWDAVRQLRYPLAAAAVLVIAATSALTVMLTRSNTVAPTVVLHQLPAPTDIQLAMNEAEKDYGESVRALEQLLAARRGSLDTATINLLDRHIALIDEAIRSAKTALAANPDNQQLPHMIVGAYERKITMLKRALRAPRTI